MNEIRIRRQAGEEIVRHGSGGTDHDSQAGLFGD